MKSEQFNLSEEEEYIDENGNNDDLAGRKVYTDKAVKEFIKRLNDRSNRFCRMLSDEEFKIFIGEINELAGEKLLGVKSGKIVIIPHKNSCGRPEISKTDLRRIEISCGDDLGGNNNEFYQCSECREKDIREYNKNAISTDCDKGVKQ